jgi:hypothetical protein
VIGEASSRFDDRDIQELFQWFRRWTSATESASSCKALADESHKKTAPKGGFHVNHNLMVD